MEDLWNRLNAWFFFCHNGRTSETLNLLQDTNGCCPNNVAILVEVNISSGHRRCKQANNRDIAMDAKYMFAYTPYQLHFWRIEISGIRRSLLHIPRKHVRVPEEAKGLDVSTCPPQVFNTRSKLPSSAIRSWKTHETRIWHLGIRDAG